MTLVVILYNSHSAVDRHVRTWASATFDARLHLRLVFVQHGADAASRRLIEQLPWHPEIEVVFASGPNTGFTGGIRLGLQFRLANSDILLLNPDVSIPMDFWRRLYDDTEGQLREATRGLVFAFVVQDSRYGNVAGITFNWLLHFSDRRLSSAGISSPLFGPSGGAAYFPEAAVSRSLDVWEPYFAWGEDADLALRTFLSGTNVVVLNIPLAHAGGHSVVGLAGRRFKARLLTRNRILLWYRLTSLPLKLCLGVPWLIFLGLVLVKGALDRTLTSRGIGMLEAFLWIISSRVIAVETEERLRLRCWFRLFLKPMVLERKLRLERHGHVS